eukprot:GILJ01001601.1.p1 GENE.GILJ01001601.1~~GILJ01001601.1.p1  ORF type:complete len:422 (+),score=70.66 GILJ01001601.1:54-1319(+)
MAANNVTSVNQFHSLLAENRNCLTVVYFWASWHPPCAQMTAVFAQLAKDNLDVKFLQVEAEELPEVSEEYGIASVPTFLFFKDNTKIDMLMGAHPPLLVKKLQEHNQTPKTDSITDKCNRLINQAPVMLFMKGNPSEPKCGFSRKMVEILKTVGVKYDSFDILTDEAVRSELKVISNWPTFPQLYIAGKLVGGVDIVESLQDDDQLMPMIPESAKEETVRQKCERLVNYAPVMLFMKGDPAEPKCGFSRKIVDLLQTAGIKFGSFDILSDETIRSELKLYSNWPTFPQLYVNGKLIGGVDIVTELYNDGELIPMIPTSEVKADINTKLKQLINNAKVMLFMKGQPDEPKCGFSSKIVKILREDGVEFSSFDILQDDEVRQALKAYSNWPTYPQLYVDGKLVGGVDIVQELHADGDLATLCS